MPFDRDRLKSRRIDMGLTLQEVADAIGVEKPTVQRYESGKINKIDTITVEKLACAIKCSPAYLMGWASSPSMSDKNADCSDIERQIINKLNLLNSIGKEYIEKQINFALAQENYLLSGTHIPDFEQIAKEAQAAKRAMDVPTVLKK